VKRRTEISFLIICGEIRTLCKCNELLGKCKEVEPTTVTGREEPLPTMILDGVKEVEGLTCVRRSEFETM
jgi:hypothetical protein